MSRRPQMRPIWHRWVYRTRQVIRYFRDHPTAEEEQLATQILPPNLLPLYRQMAANDRAHALRVCRSLLSEGHRHPHLLQAALLHDVGKAGGVPLMYRIAYVLLERLSPNLLRWLARRTTRVPAWRRPLVRLAHHPAIGAEMVAAAGAAPEVVALIRAHQDGRDCPPTLRAALVALQSVDDEV